VVDALLDVRARIAAPENPMLADLMTSPGRLALMTAHRRESFGEPLREVFSAVLELVRDYEDLRVLYPVHPNPSVTGPAEEILGGKERIHLVDPLSYTDFVIAMERADLILSDSGGVQEEAPTFGTPVLILRAVTERPEAVDAGCAILVGTERNRILTAAHAALAVSASSTDADVRPENPFGDGRAGERIADIVVSSLTGEPRETEDWIGA
jgi:UDP-N-acetylglucosamine 2-epimerase (non-hydrolysing)